MKEISDFVLFHAQTAAQCSGIPSSGSRFHRAAFQFLLPSNPSPQAALEIEAKGAKKRGEDAK